MSHRVPPRWSTSVASQVLSTPAPKPNLEPVANRFPLELPAKAIVELRLDHPVSGHTQKKRGVRSRKIPPVAAPEPHAVAVVVVYGFNDPFGPSGVAVLALVDLLEVTVGDEVLVEVAAELDGLGLREELH